MCFDPERHAIKRTVVKDLPGYTAKKMDLIKQMREIRILPPTLGYNNFKGPK